MKPTKSFTILLFLILLPSVMNGQVLISLIFGEALNTDKIEFGLAGGMSRSYIPTIDNSEGLNSFDLGFYFHILMKNSSYLSTGVHVKSNVGATGMPVYETGVPEFDVVFEGGTLTKKIPAFYVPIMFHQRFNNRWYIEAGPQLGLIYKPKDVFEKSADGDDLTYNNYVRDEYKYLDFGLMGGAGYKFKKEIKSMSAGINYYYGLMNVSERSDLNIKNSAIYFYIKIPIGAKEKEK